MFPLVDQKAAEPRGGEKCEIIRKCVFTALGPEVTEALVQIPGIGSRQLGFSRAPGMQALGVRATLAGSLNDSPELQAPHTLAGAAIVHQLTALFAATPVLQRAA